MNPFSGVFEGWDLPIVVFDTSLSVAYCNRTYEDMVGKTLSDMKGNYIFDLFPESPERVDFVKGKFNEALAGQRSRLDQIKFKLTDDDGVMRDHVWQATQEPYYNEKGEITHIIQRADDVTAVVQAQTESRLVKEELEHRMKNVHAVIQAMVRLTSRSAKSIEEFQEDFSARLHSMTQAHQRLIRSGMISVDIREILEESLSGVAPEGKNLTDLKGEAVKISAQLSRPFSMLIHELATNAVKYGCFSVDNGALDIKWYVKDSTLHMNWTETGLTNLKPPNVTGFGSKMIKMLPNIEFDADYRPTGLHIDIALPLS